MVDDPGRSVLPFVCSTLLLLGQLVADRHVCMNVNCALLVAQTIRVSTATGTRCAAQCSTTSRAAAGIQPFDWIPLVPHYLTMDLLSISNALKELFVLLFLLLTMVCSFFLLFLMDLLFLL